MTHSQQSDEPLFVPPLKLGRQYLMKIEINEKREILIANILPHVKVGSLNEELTDEAVREIEKRLELAEQFLQLMYAVTPTRGVIVSDLEVAVNVLTKTRTIFNQYKI